MGCSCTHSQHDKLYFQFLEVHFCQQNAWAGFSEAEWTGPCRTYCGRPEVRSRATKENVCGKAQLRAPQELPRRLTPHLLLQPLPLRANHHSSFSSTRPGAARVGFHREGAFPSQVKWDKKAAVSSGPRNQGPPAVRPQHRGTRCEQMTGLGRSPIVAPSTSPGHVLLLHPLSTPGSATLPGRSPKDFREPQRGAPHPPGELELNAERRGSCSPLPSRPSPKAASRLPLPPQVPRGGPRPRVRAPPRAPLPAAPGPGRAAAQWRRPAAARSLLGAPPGPARPPPPRAGTPRPGPRHQAGPCSPRGEGGQGRGQRAAGSGRPGPALPRPPAPPPRGAPPGRALPRGPPRPRRPRRAPSGVAAARPGPRDSPHLVELPFGGFSQRRVHGAPQGLDDGVGVHAGGGGRRGAGAGAAPRRAHMDPPPRSGRRRERKGSAKGPDRAAPAAATRPPAAPFRRPRPAPRRAAPREL